jgi:hypothetical protein
MDGRGRDAQIGLYVSATLAHSVHFCLLQIKILLEGGSPENRGDGEDALASYTCQYYVSFHYLLEILDWCGSLIS